ncbi:MAG: Rieske (2Fe-2S) protein [Aeromicrobium sp.]|nr:Rieske (2Fe-2S) protein [Aeromicrobium sp.]
MVLDVDSIVVVPESHQPSPRYVNGVVPQEGENGVYSQSWFPVARSEEVPIGTAIGKDFLGGRVAIFRGEDGIAQVVSSYCPHMGADISIGDVLGNTVRCPFHFWQFERGGGCIRTGSGDPVPAGARVFSFPTQERFGLIFAFNGEEPLFELPGFSIPDDQIEVLSITEFEVTGDAWEFMCNTFDFNHLIWVHGLQFDPPPTDGIAWNQWGGEYRIVGADEEGPLDMIVAIISTNFYRQEDTNGARHGYSLYTANIPKPGHHHGYQIVATNKGDGSPEQDAEIEEYGRYATNWAVKIINEDIPILNSMRFRPLRLTKADSHLRRYLRILREFPRAHPSRDFI